MNKQDIYVEVERVHNALRLTTHCQKCDAVIFQRDLTLVTSIDVDAIAETYALKTMAHTCRA